MTETGTSHPETTAADDGSAGERDAPRVPAERPRPNRWKVVFVTLLVVGLLGTVVWVLLGSRLLVVRHVEVTGTKIAPRDRVVAAAGITLGGPMVRLGAGSVEARVEKLREVESAKVERHWPGTVRIVVRERVPLAAVERGGRFYQLDKDGVIVTDTPVRPGRMPALTVSAPGPTDPATLAALHVVDALPAALSRRLTEVEASTPESVTLRLNAGLTVVWGSAERGDEKVRLYEALLRTTAGRTARQIDVSSPEVVTTR
ncbi:FtsQ-type POTRA domain-containing protein [Spirillospora sp. NPDC047279]|uniref:cell division protein FtsQ/DivIB n=1 Tax=Spirillospora sp. NPDC047279 TaxID=3155478 RepID=UPI0033C8D26D